jgi:molybdopterin molybdotransferase
MDGFAVRAADTAGVAPDSPLGLSVVDESRAGRPAARALGPGEAIAISTGAILPEGADAVVRVEDTAPAGARVEVRAEIRPGRDVRRAGEDVRAGETVLRAGTPLGAVELGVLASLGLSSASCPRRPRLCVVTTGDELLAPGEEPRPGGVRNSIALAVPALAERAGAEVATVATARDEPVATREAIERALDADVAVITGGVSVGEHDHVRSALAELSADEVFWGVALRPGRPTWFGTAPGGGLVFGLPGNPVSAVVTFLLFARLALRTMCGADPGLERATALLVEDYEKRPGRVHAVGCQLELHDDGWHARLTREAPSAHVLTSMLGAEALAIVPAEAEAVWAGERVTVELLPR